MAYHVIFSNSWVIMGVFGPWKLKGKKKIRKAVFFSLFGLRKVKRKKNREENCKENLSYYEEKIFLPNIRGKSRKNLFSIIYQKSQID